MRLSITSGSIIVVALITSACRSMPVWEDRLRSFNIDHQLYVATSGDTLRTIAERYQLSASELRALNPGLPEQPAVGTKVRVYAAVDQYASGSSRALFGGSSQAKNNVSMPVPERTIGDPALESAALNRPLENPTVEVAAADVFTSPTTANTTIVREPLISGIGTDAQLRQELLGRPSAQSTEIAALAPGRTTSLREEIITDADFDNELYGLTTPAPQAIAAQSLATVAPTYTDAVVPPPTTSVQAPKTTVLPAAPTVSQNGWYWPTFGPVARGFSPTKPNRQGIDIAGTPGQDIARRRSNCQFGC